MFCSAAKMEAEPPVGVLFYTLSYVGSFERFVGFHSHILGLWASEEIRSFCMSASYVLGSRDVKVNNRDMVFALCGGGEC